MKFSPLTPATKKTQFSTGLLLLVIFCSGCNNQFDALATQTCTEAELAVVEAQQQFEQVEDQLVRSSQSDIQTVDTSILQELQETQEYAFEICEQGG
ncbi:MAG: hypothetical protein RIE73_35235 [Coleofasciculus sp. C1-SOL-03]|jgi:uncharacterized lipoprotein NlpE involved in copper resistance|uniref:hypothetical protein n=1 Tax=Coleofasciculus sp. C1-SOL-03 TaxID=3069522 RepID=UPI003300F15C